MGIWDVWRTVFKDSTLDLSRYEYICRRRSRRRSIQPQVRDGVLFFGTAHPQTTPAGRKVIPTFLRIHTKRKKHKDVDVTVKLEITAAAHTRLDSTGTGWVENDDNWFGITTRALDPEAWDSYLFYICKNGSIEFGIHKVHDLPDGPDPMIGPTPLPQVAQQAITIRIRVEGSHIRTWANNEPRHDVRDEEDRFTHRPGFVYLLTYGVAAKLYEVEVKAKLKKWYGPFYNLVTLGGYIQRLWKIIGAIIAWICILISAAAGIVYLYDYLFRSK